MDRRHFSRAGSTIMVGMLALVLVGCSLIFFSDDFDAALSALPFTGAIMSLRVRVGGPRGATTAEGLPQSAETVVTAKPTATPGLLGPAPLSPPASVPDEAPPVVARLNVASAVGRRPNELGRIMILEYHQFGPQEDRWTRSYANFRQDLERLYRDGYRPIGMNEYIENRIDVPAGTTPIIFTFDDSSPGQFRYLSGPDGQPAIDPDSAVGILAAFNRRHPDWRLRGTFFVLAGAEPVHRLFGQPEYAQQKLRQLVALGFELGNHTFHHVQLSKLDKPQVSFQLGQAVRSIQEVLPGYQVNSLALPEGAHVRELEWAVSGEYKGTPYHNRAILEVTGGSAYSPNNRKADLLHLPRIQATNMEWDFYTAFLDYYNQLPDERYVSDGDPDVVVFPASGMRDYRPSAGAQPLPDPAPGYSAVRLR